jgi:hypothetical protein
MKKVFLIAIVLLNYSCITAQQNEIKLETNYGSKSKEILDILRFEGIETVHLKFSGKHLNGKTYVFLIKEFSNGKLDRLDTIINSKKNEYISAINSEKFELKYFVKTRLDNVIKMTVRAPRFSVTRKYNVKKSEDNYALHDFLGSKKSLPIKVGKPTYVLGYFLPYLREGGFKSYCDVSGSKFKPEEWGEKLGVPNYFLIEVMFQ